MPYDKRRLCSMPYDDRVAECVALLAEAALSADERVEVMYHQAYALRQLDQLSKAAGVCQSALASDMDSLQRARFLECLAGIHFDLRQIGDAEERLAEIQDLDLDSSDRAGQVRAWCALLRAQILAVQGSDDALSGLLQAAQMFADLPPNYGAYGKSLAYLYGALHELRYGDLVEVGRWTEAVDLEGHQPSAQLIQAEADLYQGNTKACQGVVRSILTRQPPPPPRQLARAHYLQARMLQGSGDQISMSTALSAVYRCMEQPYGFDADLLTAVNGFVAGLRKGKGVA